MIRKQFTFFLLRNYKMTEIRRKICVIQLHKNYISDYIHQFSPSSFLVFSQKYYRIVKINFLLPFIFICYNSKSDRISIIQCIPFACVARSLRITYYFFFFVSSHSNFHRLLHIRLHLMFKSKNVNAVMRAYANPIVNIWMSQ